MPAQNGSTVAGSKAEDEAEARRRRKDGRAGSQQQQSHSRDAVSYSRQVWHTWAQIWARRKLQSWGRFVATHQIPVLLTCCVFLCALTYPVLSLYAWAAPSTTSDFFDFLRTSPTWNLVGVDGSIARTRDLKLPWHDLEAVVTNAEEACWQRIPKFREVTVQQVLLGFPSDGPVAVASEHGVLDRKALHVAHELERRLQHVLAPAAGSFADISDARRPTCIQLTAPPGGRSGSGQDDRSGDSTSCLILSPMVHWGNNDNAMLSDSSLIATVNAHPDPIYHGLSLAPDVLFGGRTYSGETMRKADYAVLTLVLKGSPDPTAVNRVLREAAADLELVLVERTRRGSRMVMKHRSDVKVRSKAWEDVLFYLGYIVVAVYIYFTLRKVDKVHSRTGLVITGLVQMLASGMMSLSLCALSGYKINLVPWKLIPFLIVVLGVDNMFVLTSAVTSTSINMPVKERTAEGLARCGISIFLNLVAELCFLWGIYVFIPTRVIREMVVFNAVALVMDFCMQMTYFLTVLSVDMQRMELADFITQGSRTPSSLRLDAKKKRSALHVPPLAESMLRSFRERKARTYTAVLVVLSNWILYLFYGGDYFVPAFCSNLDFSETADSLSRGLASSSATASEVFWHLLGARPSEAVHVHLVTPAVLFFGLDNFVRSPGSNITKGSLYALIRYVAIPISFTTLALHLLLRQLLKGQELLNNHPVPPSDGEELTPPAVDESSRPLVCAPLPLQTSDIEAIAYDATGTIAVWVAGASQISICSRRSEEAGMLKTIKLRNTLSAAEVVTSLALSGGASYLAILTNAGRLLAWSLSDGLAPVRPATPNAKLASVSKAMRIVPAIFGSSDAPPRLRSPVDGVSQHPHFLVTHKNGSVTAWDCEAGTLYAWSVPQSLQSNQAGPLSLIRHRDRLIACRGLLKPGFGVYINAPGGLQDLASLATSLADEGNWLRAVVTVQSRTMLALATPGGTVEIWDTADETCIYRTGSSATAPLKRLELVDLSGGGCRSCGTQLGSAIGLICGYSSHVATTMLTLTRVEACDCSLSAGPLPGGGHSLSPSVSRRHPSPRPPSADTFSGDSNLAYPLSPHALRRLSHVSDKKRVEEALHLHNKSDGHRLSPPAHRQAIPEVFDVTMDAAHSDLNGSGPTPLSPWFQTSRNTFEVDPKGAWTLCGKVIVGMRRSTERSGHPLSRWKVWTVRLDPMATLHSGSLAVQEQCLEQLLSDHDITTSETTQMRTILPVTRPRSMVTLDDDHVAAALGNLLLIIEIPHSTGGAV